MKHQAVMLVKFKALSKRLGMPLYRTVGVLESLWLFAQHNAKDGNLSDFSLLEIAGWMEWEGDESELIEALVETKWIDRSGDSLHIHDWDQHKPNYLKAADASPRTKPRSLSESLSESPSDTLSDPHRTEPNLTEPNLTKDRLDSMSCRGDQRVISEDDIAAVLQKANRIVEKIGKPRSQSDRDFVLKVAWLSQRCFGEGWLWDAVNGVAIKKPRKPYGYLTNCLKASTKKLGSDFLQELATVELPDELCNPPPQNGDLSERLCASNSEDC